MYESTTFTITDNKVRCEACFAHITIGNYASYEHFERTRTGKHLAPPRPVCPYAVA